MGGKGGASGSSYTPVTPNHSETAVVYKIGIYGWRKRCLYLLVLILMVTVIVNLALTIWILKVMDFSIDGMGQLRITKKGLRLEGQSEFLRPLYAAEIISRKDQPLVLESARNISLNARNTEGNVSGKLLVGSRDLVSHHKEFLVETPQGKVLLLANEDEVVVGADRFRVTGAEGVVFEGSVQTPHIRAEAREELRLESTTRSLYMQAPEGILLDAEGGDFTAKCRTDLRLQSKQGSIMLDTKNIEFKNLPTSQSGASSYSEAYELCSCANGKLFIADGASGCRASLGTCPE
ncbi:zeta-sarcoglycan-like [Ptychodera flava]|uniref:zeta-sarcoglycan-like n=1 Tax=Ptychodera flava TaxID=63121 RepID=UPI003969D54D